MYHLYDYLRNRDNRLLSIYYVPGFVLSVVHNLSNSIVRITVLHSTFIYSALEMKN